jgi:hypothetical protein
MELFFQNLEMPDDNSATTRPSWSRDGGFHGVPTP